MYLKYCKNFTIKSPLFSNFYIILENLFGTSVAFLNGNAFRFKINIFVILVKSEFLMLITLYKKSFFKKN